MRAILLSLCLVSACAQRPAKDSLANVDAYFDVKARYGREAGDVLIWFAQGDPTKPFTLPRFARIVRAVYRGSERISLFTRPSAGAEKERALREPPRR